MSVRVESVEREHDEGRIVLFDGEHRCIAFCHPCNLLVGADISTPLLLFEHGNVQQSAESKCRIEHQASLGPFSQWFVARVENRKPGLVSVGNFRFVGVVLPGDLKEGALVEFAAERVDALS